MHNVMSSKKKEAAAKQDDRARKRGFVSIDELKEKGSGCKADIYFFLAIKD